MDVALTLVFLLRCCCVCSLPPVSVPLVFSAGTQLMVTDEGEDDPLRPQQEAAAPSVLILSTRSPGSPHLLVCLLTGLRPPPQDVWWWIDDTLVTSSDAKVSWVRSEEGGAYSATSVWEVPAADWRSRSTFWCGTVQDGQVYRKQVRPGADRSADE